MEWIRITKDNIRNAAFAGEKTRCDLFEAFAKANGIMSYKSDIEYATSLLDFFAKGGKSLGKNELYIKKVCSAADHSRFYKTIDGNIILVAHPYLKEDTISEFNKAFDCNYKIRVFSSDKSWYRPGETSLVIVTLKDVYIKGID